MNEKGKSTLGKFRNFLKVKNYSQNTIEIYCHYVEKFMLSYDKPALHITMMDIKQYVENYNYSSVGQQNQIYSAIKLFAKYILNLELKGKVYLERPRREKRLPKVIDSETLKSKINCISNIKHKTIITLAYSVGLRVSEVINLKIADIDSERMVISIKQAKGKKDRIVPLSDNVLDLLRKYYKQYKPNEYLFNGQFSEQYTATSCNKIVKKYIGADCHFHMLRHSSFTSMLENGTDLRVIQSIAGHNSSRTTEIYTHVSTNLMQQAHLPI
jgi:integrase/recombinase XerD